MKSKANIFSCVFCGFVILVCLICYSGCASSAYFDICTPYAYSPIEGYGAVAVEKTPEGYYISANAMPDDADDMKVVEVTYELVGVVNDTMSILGNLCYYYGENGEWLYVLEKDPDYWGALNYENCKILPPGAHMIFREYVLVPESAEQINAYRQMGEEEEEMIIPIRKQ